MDDRSASSHAFAFPIEITIDLMSQISDNNKRIVKEYVAFKNSEDK